MSSCFFTFPPNKRMQQGQAHQPDARELTKRPDPNRQLTINVAPRTIPTKENLAEVSVIIEPRLGSISCSVGHDPLERGPRVVISMQDPGRSGKPPYLKQTAMAFASDAPEVRNIWLQGSKGKADTETIAMNVEYEGKPSSRVGDIRREYERHGMRGRNEMTTSLVGLSRCSRT